jgi:hypothetical protein
MQLDEFYQETMRDVREELAQRMGEPSGYAYPNLLFVEKVMSHLSDVGMTSEPMVCHYEARAGNATVRLSGYALSEDGELDLFVSLYKECDDLETVPDTETLSAAEQCLRFVRRCAEGKLTRTMDPSNDAYGFAETIERSFADLDQIRIYVVTNRIAKSKNFKSRDVSGKIIKLEVMDIERLYRHWAEGKPRDELVVNFEDICDRPLPCVYVPGDRQLSGDEAGYDCALTVIPGDTLRFVYERYGARLLEANVRSFLSATGKVNKGIRATLREAPDRFMAYNNGIVIVADDASLVQTESGFAIAWLKGMQIVNGGQTTASIFFAKRKEPSLDLSRVRVPAKVLILRGADPVLEEALISDISRCANSQNKVNQSDLSANRPFHVQIEKLAMTTFLPDGVGRWFYERAAGSYNTMLAREGTTPAKLRRLKSEINPPSRKITKTDLARYLNAWSEQPHTVSTGSQKNFEAFMDARRAPEGTAEPLPDVSEFKAMIAKTILFKRAQGVIRPMFPAFQANITAYTISFIARHLGARMDFDRIWSTQAISEALASLIASVSKEVDKTLHATAKGRMVSEWAKKPECWQAVANMAFNFPTAAIPEVRR